MCPCSFTAHRRWKAHQPATPRALCPSLPQGLGRTCVLVGIGGAIAATISIQDPLKPEAR